MRTCASLRMTVRLNITRMCASTHALADDAHARARARTPPSFKDCNFTRHLFNNIFVVFYLVWLPFDMLSIVC